LGDARGLGLDDSVATSVAQLRRAPRTLTHATANGWAGRIEPYDAARDTPNDDDG
jgi:hypothetical protein